jgi:hypothetical protein
MTGWHIELTHAPPRQLWPHVPQLLGSPVVSPQGPPLLVGQEPVDVDEEDDELLDAFPISFA